MLKSFLDNFYRIIWLLYLGVRKGSWKGSASNEPKIQVVQYENHSLRVGCGKGHSDTSKSPSEKCRFLDIVIITFADSE